MKTATTKMGNWYATCLNMRRTRIRRTAMRSPEFLSVRKQICLQSLTSIRNPATKIAKNVSVGRKTMKRTSIQTNVSRRKGFLFVQRMKQPTLIPIQMHVTRRTVPLFVARTILFLIFTEMSAGI